MNSSLPTQTAALLSKWAGKGSLQTRHYRGQQRDRAMAVVRFAYESGARSLDDVGPGTVRRFLRFQGFTSVTSADKYRQALLTLFTLAGHPAASTFSAEAEHRRAAKFARINRQAAKGGKET